MKFRPGDVIKCHADDAPYPKWHLCVSEEGHYIYLNSPKAKSWPGDYPIDGSEVPFIPAHPTGQSIVSCRNVMKKSGADLRAAKAVFEGRLSSEVLTNILIFVDGNPVLAEDDQTLILDGLGDWCGL